MQIRRATRADADAIIEAHDAAVTESCRLHYTPDVLASWLWKHRLGTSMTALEELNCFVAVGERGAILGLGFLDAPHAEIVAVYVHPRAGGRGVGRALVRHLEACALAAGCTSLSLKASLNAVDFYWTLGYHPTSPSRFRFSSGLEVRCIGMARALVPGAAVTPVQAQMPIFLVPHDPSWATRFEEERARLLSRLGDRVLAVEHVGSTAIPGVDAKPIIDVMVLIPDVTDAPTYFDALEELQYHYFPYDERRRPERRWFCKPNPTERTHHLHLTQAGTTVHRETLAFRDHLRAREDVRARYQSLKRELARRFPGDREAYTEGKHAFITDVIAEATRDGVA